MGTIGEKYSGGGKGFDPDCVKRAFLSPEQIDFRAIFENAPDGLVLIDVQGHYLFVSPSALNIFGYSIGEMMQFTSVDKIHPDDLPEISSRMQELLVNPEKSFTSRYRYLSARQEWIWLESMVSNMLHVEGVRAIVIRFRQISDLVAAEHALTEHEKRLRELINIFDGQVYAVDSGFRLITGNKSFHLRIKELTGKVIKRGENLTEAMMLDRESNIQWTHYLERVMQGEEFTIEQHTDVHDGFKVEEITFSPIRDASDSIYGMVVFHQDITGKKRSEETLRRSEERFRMLLELATDAFFQGDEKGNFLLVNDKALELTGYSREELLSMNIKDLFKSEELAAKPLDYSRLNRGESLTRERKISRKDLTEVFVEMHSKAMPDGTYQSFFRDISNRKRAEAELKTKEEQLLTLLNATSDIICFKDSAGRWLQANNADLELFGLTGVDYYLKKDSELAHYTHEIFREAFLNCENTDELAWKHGIMSVADEVIPTIDGEQRTYEVIKTPVFNQDGSRKGLVVFGRDVTQRKAAEKALKESELKYRHIVEFLPDGVIIHAGGKIQFANPAALKILGAASSGELSGKPMAELIHPDSRETLIKRIQQTLESGIPAGITEEKYLTLAGEIIDVEVVEIPVSYLGEKAGLEIIRDISERKQAISALRESEDKFRTLAESSPYAIMIYQDDRWVYTNAAGEKLSGYSAAELYEMNFWDIATGEYREMIRLRGQSRQSGIQTTPSYEFRITSKTGDEKWVYLSGSSLLYKGRYAGIVSVIDITERKKTEEAMHREQKILRTLIDNLPDSIYFKDINGRKIVANRADLNLMGLAKEADALGKTDVEMLGYEAGIKGYNDDIQVIKSGLPLLNNEHEITGPDGRIHWILTSKIPLHDEQGKVNGLVGIGHDITLRKRAEMIQSVLLQISNAANLTNDLAELFEKIRLLLGTLLDTTNFYIAFYDEVTDMLSIPYLKDEKDQLSEWPAGKSATGLVIKNKRSLLIDKNDIELLCQQGVLEIVGEPCLHWLGVPLTVNNNAIGALVLQSYSSTQAFNVRDVEMLEFVARQLSLSIQRRKAEHDIREALVKAEESDRLKTAFLNNMSHEIRTPLNGILGFTSLLNDPDTTEEDQRYFQRIITQNGEQLLSIINDIISIATIESGQEKVRESGCDVNEVLSMLYNHFKMACAGKQIMLNYRSSVASQAAIIRTDETKLKQILSNLIGNAIKFTDHGLVDFGCKQSGDMLQFYVSDTGIGIPEHLHQVIFERFRQANADPAKEYGGNGLGLAISKAYTELLGGNIWLESSPGKGTTFYFTVPYKALNNPQAMTNTNLNHGLSINGIGKTILVAEDVYANYQLIEAILKKMSFSIIHVEDGISAVEACNSDSAIDLVLMDIKMPGMDGYEATRRIKSTNPEIPVVAVTAYALSGDRDKAIAAGCDDYITKPVKAGILIGVLNRFFGKKR